MALLAQHALLGPFGSRYQVLLAGKQRRPISFLSITIRYEKLVEGIDD